MGSASPANVPQPLLTMRDTIFSRPAATGYPVREVVVHEPNEFGGDLWCYRDGNLGNIQTGAKDG